MLFRDRVDAGDRLGAALEKYKGAPNTIVIGLPRGGVVVAYQIAQVLHLPLDVICPRKIGAPFNPEYAIGAITETGEGIFDEAVIQNYQIPRKYIEEEVEREKNIAQRRLDIFRKGKPPRDFKGKQIIVVDDGIATGATMKAAIQSLRAAGTGKIVMAVPVSPPATLEEIAAMVDETFCLDTPPFFQAVGQFYREFLQTSDEEVIDLIKSSPH